MSVVDWVASSLSSHGGLFALPAAFVGGLVMGLNPCCLAMYPAAAASCCAGSCSSKKERRPVVQFAGFFVLGNALAITVLGVAAAALGRTFGRLGGWAPYAIAFVPLLMGLHLLGWLKLPMPRGVAGPSIGGRLGAFAGGLLLSLAIGPCGTPALAAILSYAALKGSLVYAGALLFAYGLGNGLPLLLMGTLASGLTQRLAGAGWSRWIERVAGVAMLCLGFSLLWSA